MNGISKAPKVKASTITETDNTPGKIKGKHLVKGKFDIFIMETDGTHIQRLTRNSGNNDSPAWSPNGQMIAFSSDRMRNREQIFIMGADGSGQTQITDGLGKYSHPSWSPWLRKK